MPLFVRNRGKGGIHFYSVKQFIHSSNLHGEAYGQGACGEGVDMNCAGVDAQIPHKRGVGQRPEEGCWEDSRKKRALAIRDGHAVEIQGGQRERILTHGATSA